MQDVTHNSSMLKKHRLSRAYSEARWLDACLSTPFAGVGLIKRHILIPLSLFNRPATGLPKIPKQWTLKMRTATQSAAWIRLECHKVNRILLFCIEAQRKVYIEVGKLIVLYMIMRSILL